jgi:hypothetical protein
MLDVHTLGSLRIRAQGAQDATSSAPLCAASGLVKVGPVLFVVADDDNHLARFILSAPLRAGCAFPLFNTPLPTQHDARKAAKPDFESLLRLPAFGDCPFGALLALGSGSLPSRQRAAWMALDAIGEPSGPARTLDMTPAFDGLRQQVPGLNIEGAFIQDDMLCLLQRGHGTPFVNARIDWRLADTLAWLCGKGAAPQPCRVQPFELGQLDGVPLSFTDGAALPAGEWLFSAAAEDTPNSVADGACAGSAIGIVNAAGAIRCVERLPTRCKVEGVAVAVQDDAVHLWMVTDADDRTQPASLLFATLMR